MYEERFLGRILQYNSSTNILSLKVDFLDFDKQKALEEIFNDNKLMSFCFKKAYRKNKTYEQLKKYYKMINIILSKLDIYPDADIVKAFDEEVKKNAISYKSMIIHDKEIPLIPSKADMSTDELSNLIQYLYNTYGELLDEEVCND